MKRLNVETTNWLTKGISDEQLKIEKALSVISAKIYTQRTRMGFDQKAFAKFMGVSQGMVSRWESGTYNFSIATLIGICEKLDLSFEPYIADQQWNVSNISFVPVDKTSNDNGWVKWTPTQNSPVEKGVA